MNRHARRAAVARARKHAAELYSAYIRHLPRVPLDAPLAPYVNYIVRGHQPRCEWFTGGPCSCAPRLRRHVEPVRS